MMPSDRRRKHTVSYLQGDDSSDDGYNDGYSRSNSARTRAYTPKLQRGISENSLIRREGRGEDNDKEWDTDYDPKDKYYLSNEDDPFDSPNIGRRDPPRDRERSRKHHHHSPRHASPSRTRDTDTRSHGHTPRHSESQPLTRDERDHQSRTRDDRDHQSRSRDDRDHRSRTRDDKDHRSRTRDDKDHRSRTRDDKDHQSRARDDKDHRSRARDDRDHQSHTRDDKDDTVERHRPKPHSKPSSAVIRQRPGPLRATSSYLNAIRRPRASRAGSSYTTPRAARTRPRPARGLSQGTRQAKPKSAHDGPKGRDRFHNIDWQEAAKVALQAGTVAAVKIGSDPIPWTAKGTKIASAALGAAVVDHVLRPKKKKGVKYAAMKQLTEVAVGSILVGPALGKVEQRRRR